MVRRRTKYYFIILITALFVSGCKEYTTIGKSKSTSKQVAIVAVGLNLSPYPNILEKSIKSSLPPNITIQYIDREKDSPIDLVVLKKAFLKDIDLVVYNSVDYHEFRSAIGIAKSADIPIIFFNKKPPDELLLNYAKAYFVGVDEPEYGKIQGEIVQKIWLKHAKANKKKGKINYLLLQGCIDTEATFLRSKYVLESAKKRGVPMEQTRLSYCCNFDTRQSELSMDATFDEGLSDVDVIIANDDSIALGALKSLQKHGYNLAQGSSKFIPLIGAGGLPDAINAIKEKKMTATVFQDWQETGVAIANLILNITKGKKLPAKKNYSFGLNGSSILLPLFGEDNIND